MKVEMTKRYILIDLENIQPSSFEGWDTAKTKIIVFIGATQRRVPECTKKALDVGKFDVEYVQISGTGPNALDFHIAYHLGKISETDPRHHFRSSRGTKVLTR